MGRATVELTDTSQDRVSFAAHLRLLADLLEAEGTGPSLTESVRQPYVAPKLTMFGTVPPDVMIAFRARRNKVFGADLFGEPGWDMMLELFRAKQQERRLSVKSLTIASNAPQTTAGRHLARLVEQGLAECSEDPGDARRKLVGISRDGYRRMDALFAKAA